MKLARSGPEKEDLKEKSNQRLKQAEAIKSSKQWDPKLGQSLLDLENLEKSSSSGNTAPPSDSQSTAVPTNQRKLTKHEQLILLRGAKLNGDTFPPWKEEHAADDEFARDESGLISKHYV